MVLTEKQAHQIVDQSLADFLPEATRLTRIDDQTIPSCFDASEGEVELSKRR